ncbi:hypothetical protein OQA88_1906 [Cercophora sp. LCS_1]
MAVATLPSAQPYVGRIPAFGAAQRSLPRSKKADHVLTRQGIDIALSYFNFGTRDEIPALTVRARLWANKYFRRYRYGTKRAVGLLQSFPDLFNLDIDAPFRLCPAKMSSPASHPEPEGNTLRDHKRAVRKSSSEPFPAFSEPLLASEEEIDEIIDLRPRNSHSEGKAKPIMRVDAGMLRSSGLLSTLPEFLGQLARSNLELETELANKPGGAGFELNDDTADDQPHVEMDVYAGLVETQKRRHARRVVIPSSGVDLRDELIETSSRKLTDTTNETTNEADANPEEEEGDSSGYDTDASTSTTASLHVNLKKQRTNSDIKKNSPSRIRLYQQHPTSVLSHFDMKTRQMIHRPNPAITTFDPFVAMDKQRKAAAAAAASTPSGRVNEPAADSITVAHVAPATPSSPTESTSSSSSEGTTRIIKIRVPESMRSKSNSPASSRDASPVANTTASPTRTLVIRSPSGGEDIRRTLPPSSRSVSPTANPKAAQKEPSPPIRIVVKRKSEEPEVKKPATRIVVVNKRKSEEPEEERPTKRARPSIEEV